MMKFGMAGHMCFCFHESGLFLVFPLPFLLVTLRKFENLGVFRRLRNLHHNKPLFAPTLQGVLSSQEFGGRLVSFCLLYFRREWRKGALR